MPYFLIRFPSLSLFHAVKMNNSKILYEYDKNIRLYKEHAQSMEVLLSALLTAANIKPHSISSRLKERESLSLKIEKKNKYVDLSEITDIVGLRIITNYSDEVDDIAKIIEREFAVDLTNSIDKRTVLDPDRFGYLSIHYVVSLSQAREELVEYKRFKHIRFEVQVRSILQHTWAEIEHDIGYKTKVEIPKSIRREFSRLAGLLEIADDQFIQIRDTLMSYEKQVQSEIVTAPELVDIDAISIYELLNTNALIQELDSRIAQQLNIEIKELSRDHTAAHMRYLEYFHFKSISKLIEALSKNIDNILIRATDLQAFDVIESRGICLFFLYQVLASKYNNDKKIRRFLDRTMTGTEDSRDEICQYLLSISPKMI